MQVTLLEDVEEHLERWRPVADAPIYQVSSLGRVRRAFPEGGDVEVASWPNAKGYQLVNLEIAGAPRLRYVHRLVLFAFAGPARGRVANHLNGEKSENTVANLEWASTASNVLHGRRLRAELLYGQRSLLELFGGASRQGGFPAAARTMEGSPACRFLDRSGLITK